MKKIKLFFITLILGTSAYLLLINNSKLGMPKIFKPQDNVKQEKNYGKEDIVAKNLRIPWAIAFLPNGDFLLTQREGQVLLTDKEFKENPQQIADLTNVKAQGEGGLMGVAIHPDFNQNKYIYLYYTFENNNGSTLNRVSRFVFENNSFQDEKIIVDNIPGNINHNGGRIKFGPASTQRGEPDGFLYIGTGDAQNPSLSQNKNSLAGKILRVTDQGKPAPGNPFNNEVYSYGHRNVQGLSWDDQGNLWATEHGASAKDELNKIEKGGNYGWPNVTGDQTKSGIFSPVINSGSETWAPSGLTFHKNAFYFAGLRGVSLFKYDPSSGSLSKFFEGNYGRIREVVEGPDGALYILTSNTDGRGIPKKNDDKIIRLSL